MTYEEVIGFLYKVNVSRAINPSLEHPLLLSQELGFPERAYPAIHIAGTNGKGSVSTKIARALQFSGLKVGLYTSPHLSTFRERMEVNGVMISEEEVCRGMDEILKASEKLGIKPTFFEMTTALCFAHFHRSKVDAAVIETGLGGRWDATNIVQPLLSVITSIDYDHQAILGDTLEAIALEKAGIIKPRTPVVIGSRADLQPIWRKALEREAPVTLVPKTRGDYDAENSAVARAALNLLSRRFPLSAQAIEEGLRLRPPCRLEKVGEAILDVAHNPDGFRRLFEALQNRFPNQPIRLVVGLSKDKDIKSCLKIAASKAKHIHLVKASSSRAADFEELSEELRSLGASHYSKAETISKGIADALTAGKGELIVICGSFYIMAEARRALGIDLPEDSLDLNHLAIKI